MSDRPRQTLGLFPAALRNPSSTASSQQSSTLSSRVEAKRAELENLQQLRDTSALLASRMQALEQKLSTLRDGTEAVACVMANWGNVLSSIQMASSSAAMLDRGTTNDKTAENHALPTALVRIPVESQHPSNQI